ncbi:hypothetical protein ABZS29_10640 [Kribbella sp. NPDC005582]|uniref:hypothetical protein n=1 Tax=Kribbella sp. NPDC005582 TaxID=3156893 RepID=UPI0033BDB9B9
MTNRRLLAALLAVPLTFTTLGTATAAQAAGDPDLEVDSLVLSRGSVAVSSLNTVPVTITLKGSAKPSDYDTFYVEFTGGQRKLYSMPLKLIKGTLDDGTWQGVVNVPSTANGTIKATRVIAGGHPFGCGQCDFDYPVPVAGPTLAVTGVHIPKITATFTPKAVQVGQSFTLKWTVTDSQTGKPYGTRIRMNPTNEVACAEGTDTRTVLSDLSGSVTLKLSDSGSLYCVRLPGNPAPIASAATYIPTLPAITAAPAKTSAAVGTIVPVNGTVAYASGCTVNLQRLYGATAWRTVGTAKVRSSARFTLSAQPSYKGVIPYRVQFPACSGFVAGVSKTFTIRGI